GRRDWLCGQHGPRHRTAPLLPLLQKRCTGRSVPARPPVGRAYRRQPAPRLREHQKPLRADAEAARPAAGASLAVAPAGVVLGAAVVAARTNPVVSASVRATVFITLVRFYDEGLCSLGRS